MRKKLLAVSLAALLVGSISFTSCKDKGDGGEGTKVETPIRTISETAPHYYAGGLHRVNITDNGKKLVENGKTEYTIVFDSSVQPVLAPLSQYIYEASDVTLKSQEDDEMTWTESQKWIVVGSEKLFTQAGLTMPKESLGSTGFYMISKGNSVFIMAEDVYGIQNGIYTFLEYTIGYDAFSEDTVTYNRMETIALYDFDVTEKPDYEFLTPSNNVSTTGAHQMRMSSTSDVMIPTNGTYYHNSLFYVPPETYLEDHPKWYNTDVEHNDQPAQLCYTAHGDKEEYGKMMSALMEKMKYYISQSGCEDSTTITITMQDNPFMCECDACMEVYNTYGTHAAAVIRFMNDVSVHLDEYLTQKAAADGTEKREINLLFFAYKSTQNAPVKEVNGKYEPIDESVRCRDNVCVMLAPINAYYNHSFYDEKNAQHAKAVEKWAGCSSKLYLWLYNTNFEQYLYAYNSFDATVETYRYCKNHNAIYMYNQGQYNQTSPTGFSVLKEYLNAKALWNVNYSTADIYDKFFKGYFGEASVPMRRFFDEMQSHLKYIDEVYSMELPGGIYDKVKDSKYYSKVQLEKWLSYVDEAYEAIEPLKATNPEKYNLYAKHIKQESLYPRCVLIDLFSGYYTSAQLEDMKASFLADAEELKVSRYSEPVTLNAYVAANW